jgi:hypothetical protein
MGSLTSLNVIAVVLTMVALAGWNSASAEGGGAVVGEVKLIGAPPAPRVVEINKDSAVCGQGKKIVDVAVGPANGVANAVVSIPDSKNGKPPSGGTVDQKGCEFHPVVVVMAPGELNILNSDSVLHNIHSFSSTNPPFNKAQPKFRKKISEDIDRPEIIPIRCDVHSWMHAWLFVTDHPAAVTDTSGTFKIDGIPPGKHKIEVWHPFLGTQSKTVEVKSGQAVKVTFELAAKKS